MDKNQHREQLLAELEEKGVLCDRERRLLQELRSSPDHFLILPKLTPNYSSGLYGSNDLQLLQSLSPSPDVFSSLQTLDDLLERDEQRENDGFPKKIKIGKIVRSSKTGERKVVVVPSTTEDRFMHDSGIDGPKQEEESSGSGEGEEGDIISEVPLNPQGEGASGAGNDGGGEHGIEEHAYEWGKIFVEKFNLPNLQDKGKKKVLKRYKYDLTDIHRGSGQLLDRNRTLKRIIETNLALGTITDPSKIDPRKLLVDPKDKVFRVLSREKDYESQAIVFFARDYSGSMDDETTRVVVTQHIFINAWLTYQYERLVDQRFFVHDENAKEVPTFSEYIRLRVGGGTMIYRVFEEINRVVEEENLARDYNIYVCYGSDGDDWNKEAGKRTLAELEKMMTYVNRVGLSVVHNAYGGSGKTLLEKYVEESEILKRFPNLIRMDVMDRTADEERIFESIRKLFSSEKNETA